MTNTSADDWSNYWQGRTGEQSGAALVGAGIENDADLTAFWQGVFSEASSEARVLDLACGAGSALKHAASAGIANLSGADISPGALSSLKAAVPSAAVFECSASDTGLPDASFDFVVSQFGIEYAGLEAAASEVARLLAAGGKFIAIVHMTGGGIEQEVAGRLKEGEAIRSSNFIPLAKDMFRTIGTPRSPANDAIAQKAAEAFRPAEQGLAKLAAEKGGLAAHLYQGTGQLYQRRKNYELSDILGWLDGMQGEIDAYVGRMSSMIASAASEEDVQAARSRLQEGGCEPAQPERFQLGGKDAAWVLRAVKR